jgi:hypothetical protein
MLSRLALALAAALAIAAPAAAQDEAAMVKQQGGTFAGAVSVFPSVYLYQLTDTGLSASLTLSGTKFFKDPDLH